jgi:hypothetical protein
MNDTTNSALQAGRLIVGNDSSEDRKCGMHVVELCVAHASGFIVRMKNKQIVDDFPACVAFRDTIRNFVLLFSERKAKGRFVKYSKFVKRIGETPIRIMMPNKTRVAGKFRMYEGALHSHSAIV